MDYSLAYPKKKPANDFSAGFDSYQPPASNQASTFRPPARAQGGGGMEAGLSAASGMLSDALPFASAAFDIYGGIEQANQQEKLAEQARQEYLIQRDQEAAAIRKQDELNRIKATFDSGNYAANARGGLHSSYDQYYQNIGL